VTFQSLALAVVDEQHRFGVRERLARPIRRSGRCAGAERDADPAHLVLTYFGDMDVSELREKPAGRQPIDTRAVSQPPQRGHRRCRSRAQCRQLVYWICPLVEESETVQLTNAEQRFNSLKERFGDKVGLVHGKMKARERSRDGAVRRRRDRASGRHHVVEVGVDVPAASIMVIENAERFGWRNCTSCAAGSAAARRHRAASCSTRSR